MKGLHQINVGQKHRTAIDSFYRIVKFKMVSMDREERENNLDVIITAFILLFSPLITYVILQESLSMAIGELFMSCLHAWGLDPQLDDLCLNKLGLHKPKCPISFGLLSHRGHMSLMLPGWHRHQNLTGSGSRKSSVSSTSGGKRPTVENL